MNIIDQEFRNRALDPQKSFIVQAPAGSGKTELLTQRFLQLLSQVEKPEEIVAITFTRKAAGEMRSRILQALISAQSETSPSSEHQKKTRELAKTALIRDQQLQWNIIQNPNRLRVLTIDALCASICAQTPLLSQLGGQANICEEAFQFYRRATQEFLKNNSHAPEVIDKIESLLLHLDNRVFQLEELFTRILAKREQWLPHVMNYTFSPKTLKSHLENALEEVRQEVIAKVEGLFSDELKMRVLHFLRFSQEQLQEALAPNLDFQQKPNNPCNFTIWTAIANLLLTQAGTFRKSVTKTQGFPPKHPMKIEFEGLLAFFSEDENLRLALYDIIQCPPNQFNDTQWEILEALFILLPHLCAQLQLVFAEHSVLDFVELNLRARFALGTEEEPTDLALYLDHKIQHLLIDEFQDTSMTQYQLIEKLIAGWTKEDGRTLFLVGDPMQSIYRFREANVGLFLQAQTQGLGQIPLEFLPLRCNFRSETKIVDWLNSHFPSIFPGSSDITSGAVPYSPAQSTKASSEYSGVFFQACADEKEEALSVLEKIQHLQRENPEKTIAILVRSRSQLHSILPVLNQHSIPFHAVEIESLETRPEIQDLFTLTSALLHFADRLSWFALLRTPFCGLRLADLHRIALKSQDSCIWEALLQLGDEKNAELSADGLLRVQRVGSILKWSLEQKGRISLSALVEGTWRGLAGPSVLSDPNELTNAKVFFQTLAKLEQSSRSISISQMRDQLKKLSATPKMPGNSSIQVMTIHKSKGLEFDHVILPGLAKTTAQDPSQILLWSERVNARGKRDLLLAPIKSSEEDCDPIYAYLRQIEKNKSQNELTRLLYVAITRAKCSVHCLAPIKMHAEKADKIFTPPKNSFLSLLWSAFSKEQNSLRPLTQENIMQSRDLSGNEAQNLPSVSLFKRLILSKETDVLEGRLLTLSGERLEDGLTRFKPHYPAIIGSLIHLALEKYSLGQIRPEAYWRNQAMNLGLPLSQFPYAYTQIQLALHNIQNDEKGRWILQHRANAASELAISTREGERLLPLIVDRSFCDENGVRWIIDYKTSVPNNEPLEHFFEAEAKRYRPQLEQYAEAFAKMEARPIRLALYFPLIPGGFYAL